MQVDIEGYKQREIQRERGEQIFRQEDREREIIKEVRDRQMVNQLEQLDGERDRGSKIVRDYKIQLARDRESFGRSKKGRGSQRFR